ncbi:MAG: hypothetical protein K2K49_05195 [Duncaniella sp.]|nr:hypothetical protein [Duncaniella sp.]
MDKTLLTREENSIRKALIKRAKIGSNYSYTQLTEEVCPQFDMDDPSDRGELGHVLGNISRFEVEHGRPMLSAIVVRQDTRIQGGGFFDLAEELGLMKATDTIEGFAVAENRRVKLYWKSHSDI